MTNEDFSAILIDAVKHRYGRLIPSTKLASEIDRITNGEVSLSSEAVRKWMRALSMPNGSALVALDELLGDYFIQKRKLKKLKNPIANSLDRMCLEELIETQRLVHFRIENSYKKEFSQIPNALTRGNDE